MYATIQIFVERKRYQHFMFIFIDGRNCGKVWKITFTHSNRGIVGNLQIDKSSTLVAR